MAYQYSLQEAFQRNCHQREIHFMSTKVHLLPQHMLKITQEITQYRSSSLWGSYNLKKSNISDRVILSSGMGRKS